MQCVKFIYVLCCHSDYIYNILLTSLFLHVLLESEACYNLALLFLKSETSKGLCIAAHGAPTITLNQIAVKLIVNDINHQYTTNCGDVGSTLLDYSYDFSCALNFIELKEVEFEISGYNASSDNKWTTTVRVTITHQCIESAEGSYVAIIDSFKLTYCFIRIIPE